MRATWLLALAATVVTAALPPSVRAEDKKYTIAVIPKGTTHEYWKSVHAGAEKAAQETGAEVIWKGPLKEDDRQSQIDTVENFINRQVNGIVLAPLDDTALGPQGALGAALTPLASLAVDPRLNALGAPFFVAADGPDPVHAILVAQDVGGAIRGPVRGDIFFGFGPDAERRAGAMKAPGRLFVLLPNALAARIGAGARYGSGQ